MEHLLRFLLFISFPIYFLSCTENGNDIDWSEERIIEISSEIVAITTFGEPSVVDGMKIRIQEKMIGKYIPQHLSTDLFLSLGISTH